MVGRRKRRMGMNGYYEFRREDAIRFARDKGFRAKEMKGGSELQFTKCPYCGMNTDSKNKFSINLSTGQFNCFRASCGAKGNMITLAKDFDFDLGTDFARYDMDMDWKKARTFGKIKLTPKAPAIAYMESRGISEEICNKYSITTTDKDNVIVFPFYDMDGELLFIKYRKTDFNKETDKNKEWCEIGERVPILFGMNQCNLENKTLVITEGQIDSLSCAEAGVENAVSVPTGARGFTWVPHCWDWINKNFNEIIVFGDYEKGKISLLSEIHERFKDKVIKHVSEEYYKGEKDANDILRKYGKTAILEAIQNAVDVANPYIMSITDVVKVEYDETQSFKSFIPSLDRLIGRFYPTQLCILTGERGRGKSTLASQLAIEAAAQGQKVFFYSGELTNSNFAEWTYQQIAGKERMIPKGLDEYWLSDANKKDIDAWLKDKFMIFNSDLVTEDLPKMVDIIKESINRYGCKAIFIDNLMTAVEDDLNADIYRMQTKFIKELKLIAKVYSVFILLIAHPKKRDKKSGFVNDDILGSSNVTNLADLVLRFDKPDGTNNDDIRHLYVMKNRRNGKTDKYGFQMFYQESSRRLSETGSFDKQYLVFNDTEKKQEDMPSWFGLLKSEEIDFESE